MSETPARRLSDVVRDVIPEEVDDRRWERAEHYLVHIRYCVMETLLTLSKLASWSRDEKSRKTAITCYGLVKGFWLGTRHPYRQTLDYIQTIKELENARDQTPTS